MIVQNEVIELELGARRGFNLPEQKSSKGIALHQAVEQFLDLLWLPYELPLNCGKHVRLGLYSSQRVSN
jgi:hypothetical protein